MGYSVKIATHCKAGPASIDRVCAQQNGSDERAAVYLRCPKWETEKYSAAKRREDVGYIYLYMSGCQKSLVLGLFDA